MVGGNNSYLKYINTNTSATTSDYLVYADGTASISYPRSDNINWGNNLDSTKLYIPEIEQLKEKIAQLDAFYFREVVVKCEHCGQWGAAMSACKHCGAPIDLGKDMREKEEIE